ncbi:MAG: putative lipid II flippase FtsW [Synergistaceae bacterium]|jgi:cell division protein FtsW|nr:putative lipid II flippase FtsW [Synergistaceae bacterium]
MRETEAVYVSPRRSVDFGEARSSGQALKVDSLLWLIPLILSGIGLLMVTSTTSPLSFEISGTPFIMGARQLKWLGLGVSVMLFSYCVPVKVWFKTSGVFWLLSLVATIATLIPGIGTAVGGAQRWIRIAGISIQPSEILTLSVVIIVAKLSVRNEMNPERCFSRIMFLLFVSAIPLMAQPDLGSTILIVMICMGMYVERFGWRLPIFTGMCGSVLLAFVIIFEPYRMRRIMAFLNPWLDPLDTGFQTIQGLIAFANGGTWGAGLGHGFQKLQYLPAAYTDFIYAALGEEMGLIGTLGILALCLMWIWRCRLLYNRVDEGFETSLVWGVTLTIAVPFFINVAGVTKLMPLTGMPLPFISYGGSALVMMWMRVGLLLRMHKEFAESS